MLAEVARQSEQLQGVVEVDRVHALAGSQAGKAWFVGVFSGADLGERPKPAETDADRLATGGVDAQIAGAGGFTTIDRFHLVFDQRSEWAPEFMHERHPVALAARDGVKVVLHSGGEVVIDVLGEMVAEEVGNCASDVSWAEAPTFEFDVLPEQQGLDDAGVGRGSADAVLLQGLDQGGFGIARGRFGEMLFGANGGQWKGVAGCHGWQFATFVVVLAALAVLALFVDSQEARIDDRGAAGAEGMFVAAGEFNGDRVEGGGDHLAGDGALPDKLVQASAVLVEEAGNLGRGTQGGGRSDRFVRFLGVFRFGLVEIGSIGQGAGAEVAGDHVAQFGQGFGRQIDRVGSHVADQADRAFAAEGDAFVELLRDPHGAAGREAELAGGFLLQGGGGERRCGAPLAFLRLDVGDPQTAVGGCDQTLAGGFGGLAVGDGELLEFLAVELDQAGAERLPGMGEVGVEAPVFAGDEGFDFLLAFDDHAQGR